jgi:hypothetical protein
MKRNKNIILTGLGLVALMAICSCKKSENFPVNHYTSSYIFDPRDSNGTNAQSYLQKVYLTLKSGHNRVNGDYLDAASDDAISSEALNSSNQVTELSTGNYSASGFPTGEDTWTIVVTTGLNSFVSTYSSYWSGIRYANVFIAGIPVVPVKDVIINGKVNGIGVSTRYIWQSEARFLRAFFYFELVKRYGGVPLLGNTVYNINDNLSIPRSSFSDCINYIVNECDAIKDSLITVQTYSPSADNWRATKGAAMALKARALLYAASPLFNDPSNSITNPLLGYTNYDATRWATAAQAAQDVINLGTYSLDPNYQNVFLTENDPENLFIRETDIGVNVENDNAPVGFPTGVGQGITSPTQDLVNAYPMSNGVRITDPTSGYDPANPYANRDPRLSYNILYNGSPWLNGTVQTYNGGASRPLSGALETLTGYYMNKFMSNEDATASTFVKHDEDWVIFRYAEILLDYAEAENEVTGPTPAVYAPLIQLRTRAGISATAPNGGSYGLENTSSKDTMRAIIQNERRIEMAFEEQRFFDIRRWKLAATVMNQPRMGVSIQNSGGTLIYNYVPVLTGKFVAPKMYLYPIPYPELIKDPSLKQNPGW